MLGRGLLLACALAVGGSDAAALPVRVLLDWPSGRPASAAVSIQALRTVGPTAGGVPVEAEASQAGVVLELGDGVWQVRASALGYWSPATEVVVGPRAAAAVRLALWPAVSLRGEILTAGGEPLPRDIEVRLTAVPVPAGTTAPVDVARREPGPSLAELRCPIRAGSWSCVGPAGLFDLRLQAAGYAPRHAWGVSLQPAAGTDLGRTVLRKGASVLGRAVRRDGSNPQGPCSATLRADPQADVTRRGSPEADREGAPESETILSVALSRRGFFHLVGVPPGVHVLGIECPAASAVRELRVAADGETRIDQPLLLEELTLDVVVAPRVDRDGRPWRLTVVATAPRWRRIADRATASADGRWARRGLTAGTYRVAVQSSDGTPCLQRVFDLGPDSGPVLLRVGFVGVAGRVLLNTLPLRATLVFFNEAGGEPVTLTSDDDGLFQGLLPVAPEALETQWTVEARAAQPPINRRLEGVSVRPQAGEASAWLELTLPMVAVRGTVVSEAGEPQSGAQVTFEDTSSGARTAAATDGAGSFELRELPAGSYAAVAESADGVSEGTALEVLEGVESELELVLNRSERVAFDVVSSHGPVVDATVQIWIPPGVPRGVAQTDADGRFEAVLPPGTAEVGLTVRAPGHALKLTRLSVGDQTITLSTTGGTLLLDLQKPGRDPDSSATLFLVHGGAIEAAGALAGWGGAAAGSRGPTVIEPAEPGVYALCASGPDELPLLWRGTLPSDRCRTGSLEHGGTLTLSPP